jgi:hypothetical protein
VVVAASDAAPTQRRIPMSRLTDTQLVILSSASRRTDRGVDLPANVTGEPVRKAVNKLIRAGLLEEVCANGSLLAWRRDAEAGPMALRTPSRASKRSRSKTMRLALLRRHPLVRLLSLRSKPLQPKPSLLARGFLSQRGGPFARSTSRARRRPKSARRATAGRARNRLACWRC